MASSLQQQDKKIHLNSGKPKPRWLSNSAGSLKEVENKEV